MADPTCLSPEQLAALARLKRLPALAPFYLAGGCAVAHHLGHRASLDLDLFCTESSEDLERARGAIHGELGAEVVAASSVAVSLRAGELPIDLVVHPYPLLEPPAPGPAGYPVAGLRDLATNKLAVLARRGIRRDFWDLFAMAQGDLGRLDLALHDYPLRFGVAEADLYHVLKALTYFEDAEAEPILPRGMTPEVWGEIKAFFCATVPALARRRWRGP